MTDIPKQLERVRRLLPLIDAAANRVERRVLSVTGNLYTSWMARVQERDRLLLEAWDTEDEVAFEQRLLSVQGESPSTVWTSDGPDEDSDLTL